MLRSVRDRLSVVMLVLICGLLGYFAGDRGLPNRRVRHDDELTDRLRAIELRLARLMDASLSVPLPERSASRQNRDGVGSGTEALDPELKETLKEALREYAESAPDMVLSRGPVCSERTDDDQTMPKNSALSIDLVLAATDAVLARALEEGMWSDGYERAYNDALAEASDQAWAQAQRRFAAAVNSGRLTLPEDFMPGP